MTSSNNIDKVMNINLRWRTNVKELDKHNWNQ